MFTVHYDFWEDVSNLDYVQLVQLRKNQQWLSIFYCILYNLCIDLFRSNENTLTIYAKWPSCLITERLLFFPRILICLEFHLWGFSITPRNLTEFAPWKWMLGLEDESKILLGFGRYLIWYVLNFWEICTSKALLVAGCRCFFFVVFFFSGLETVHSRCEGFQWFFQPGKNNRFFQSCGLGHRPLTVRCVDSIHQGLLVFEDWWVPFWYILLVSYIRTYCNICIKSSQPVRLPEEWNPSVLWRCWVWG